ncbi:MAG: FAD-dependent oxidoreductase [Myxococcales bacterium]|nr:MAG: FAD-dependent oxidoreductase [Myxococcales bacterium]
MSLLFSPIRIRSLKLPNRIVMPAMHLNFTMDGMVNKKLIEFYRLRAKGGCGLLQIGGCPVDPEAGGEYMIGVNGDKYLPGLKSLVDVIHSEGSHCGLQLYHAGRYTYSFFLGGKQPPSASATLSGLTREMSREMTVEEIRKTVQDFADSAARVKEAGFDVVEVIASAGYLVNQFFSPLTNLRTDEYGGSLENRLRFGVEVVQAIRRAVGPDFPITVRLSGNDFVEGSNTNKENALLAKALEAAGADMFNVTGGWHESRVPQITNALPRAGFAYLARNVKRLVKAPVAAANRINTPEMAEQLLRDGWCDLVSLGRALITDAEWPLKAREGRSADILHCISCNQECLDNIFQLKPLGCLVNPRVGHEDEPEAPKTPAKKVLVLGGGPAGLTAAATLARRGHSVEVVEKRERVGGQVFAASVAPNKSEFATLAETLFRQATLAGATVATNVELDEKGIVARRPDLVVLATGGQPLRPPIEGLDRPEVVEAMAVLDERRSVGQRVVVIGGGPIGVEAALYAAAIGTIEPETAAFLLRHRAEDPETIRALLWRGNKQVTLVEMQSAVGQGIGKSTKWIAMKEIKEMGVEVLTQARVVRIDDAGAHLDTPEGARTIPVDTVILAAGMTAHNPYANLAARMGDKVVVVGDAGGVSDAAGAIRDAYRKLRAV